MNSSLNSECLSSESGPILPYGKVQHEGYPSASLTNKLSYELPGYGEPKKFSDGTFKCGIVTGGRKCSVCGEVHPIRTNCTAIRCRTCFKSACNRAAKNAASRVEGAGKALREVGIKTGSVKHIVLSPSPGEFDPSKPGWDKRLRDLGAKYAEQIGVIAYAMIVHPARVKDSVLSQLRRKRVLLPFNQALADQYKLEPVYLESGDKVLLVPALKYYKGEWECVRLDILGLGGPENYIEDSPHLHLVGYFPNVLEKSNEFFLRTGWIYKNKGSRNSLHGTFFYLLTHHLVIGNGHGVTYRGLMSYNRLAVSKWSVIEDLNCRKCDGPVYKYRFVDELPDGSLSFDRAEEIGRATKKVIKSFYRLRTAVPLWQGSLEWDGRHILRSLVDGGGVVDRRA